ncbi:hypothetical protein TrRE_jg1521, partial [Triparma retinervis]
IIFSHYFFWCCQSPALTLINLTRLNLSRTLAILLLLYVVIVVLFAAIVYGLAYWSTLGDSTNLDRQCLGGDGQVMPDGTTLSKEFPIYLDVLSLSWTTFTTVGYGNIYPSSIARAEQSGLCILINFIMMAEAFFGIIWASLSAGIIVTIISRNSRNASVRFSSVILIHDKVKTLALSSTGSFDVDGGATLVQGGGGVGEVRILVDETEQDNPAYHVAANRHDGGERGVRDDGMPSDDDSDSDTSSEVEAHTWRGEGSAVVTRHSSLHSPSSPRDTCYAPPMLEFRLANERWKSTAVDLNKKTTTFWRRIFNLSPSPRLPRTGVMEPSCGALVNASLQVSVGFFDYDEIKSTLQGRSSLTTTRRKKVRHHASSLRYLPLELIMKDHPFFEQTWYARHILDHSSPLVKPRTRKLIKVHDGKWPRAIFSYNKKYSSLTDSHPLAEHLRKFDKILVTVSGTEFDTGRDVSRTHKYGPESVILGARFGSMEVLSTDPTRTGRLELEKINDIVLQPGHLLPGRLVQEAS